MKKADMVKTIQEKEAEMFLEMRQYEWIFGPESDPHKRSRSRWGVIMDIMEELGIEKDLNLPDAEKAFEVWMKIYEQQHEQ